MPSPIIKRVSVLRTEYTTIINAGILRQYIINGVKMGSASDLFQNPSIATIFYDDGTDAADAIQKAINDYTKAPTEGNLKNIADKMALGVIWLNSYADQVELISNDDANRDNREEAATNIMLSFLTPQKLGRTKKGKPEVPELTAKFISSKSIYVELQNGKGYKPSNAMFMIISLPAKGSEKLLPEVTLDRGQVKIKTYEAAEIYTQTADGKGTFTTFNELTSGMDYVIYVYAQNGKKQCSKLSVAIYLRE